MTNDELELAALQSREAARRAWEAQGIPVRPEPKQEPKPVPALQARIARLKQLGPRGPLMPTESATESE